MGDVATLLWRDGDADVDVDERRDAGSAAGLVAVAGGGRAVGALARRLPLAWDRRRCSDFPAGN